MASEWRWYLGDRDHYLRDRADELAVELRAAASRERRERARLARQQGSLQQQLERLADDLARLVELSDLRDELDVFNEHEALRRRVRAQLTSLEVLGAPPRAGGDRFLRSGTDVAEATEWYWLAWAARALPALMADDGPDLDQIDLVEARRLDPARTDRFVVLLLTLAGRGRHAAGLLGSALGPVDGPVSRAQRALWRAAADGMLGTGGVDEVERWLGRVLDTAPRAGIDEAIDRWRDAALAGLDTPMALPSSLSRGDVAAYRALREPLAAARLLVAVADRCRAAAPGTDGRDRTPQPVPATGPTAPAPGATPSDEPAGRPGAPAPSATPPDEPGPGAEGRDLDRELRWALMTLVDEGSEEEAPLLRQVERLRAALHDHSSAPGSTGDPDVAVGDLIGLVISDALGDPRDLGPPPEADPGSTTALAWRIAGVWLGPLRARLEDRAARLPAVPPPVVLEIGEATVTATGEPFPPGVVERLAEAAADRAYPPPEGLLSRIRSDDNSDARDRHRRRLIDRATETGAALAVVRAELATLARDLTRARYELGRVLPPPD